VPKKDAAALAARMRALYDDPEARRREGDDGIARAMTRFGEQRYISDLLATYEQMQPAARARP
jgi:glycosyltransferase involved in cell wall biosynthesis